MELRRIVRDLDDGVIAISMDGSIRAMNPRAVELLGVGESYVGRPFRDLSGQDTRNSEFYQMINHTGSNNKVQRKKIKYLRDKDSVEYFDVTTSVLWDEEHKNKECIFVSFPGPFMSMLIPAYGFAGVSIFVPRVAGFWITHALILTAGPLLAINGLYVPKFKDIPKNAVTLFCIAMAIFGIDVLFRVSGLNPVANYFYLMSPEKNPLLELLYSFVPVPLLYILPFGSVVCMIMFILHATVYTLVVKVVQKLRRSAGSVM